jgi:hypothetical protein
MSSQNYSYTSSSASYSSSTPFNGRETGHAYQESTHSDPSGTRVQTTSQKLGELPIQETRYFDSEGRQVLEGGRTVGSSAKEAGRIQSVEDVQDE